MDDRAREGLALLAAGDKAVNKKTLFGRKAPDYDQAVSNFEQAATTLKNARAYEQAVEAYVKAADAHKNLDSYYLAAKSLEAAAVLLVQQLKRPEDAAEIYKQTSDFYLAHGSNDRAADVLEKAAKSLELSNPDLAIQLYDDSCSTYESEDKLRFGVDTFKRFIAFLLKSARYQKALEISARLSDAFLKIDNRPGFAKQGLSTVIIALVLGDEVEANKRFSAYAGVNGFVQSNEGMIAAEILQAYETGDEGLLDKTLKMYHINHLDNEVTRLARSVLRVPGGRGGGVAPGVEFTGEEEGDGIL